MSEIKDGELYVMLFFFFQAEDGIRDVAVTGVQTCALPISVADKFATPTYLYSSAAIDDAYREFQEGLRGIHHTICFAVKSNGNLSILQRLAKLGSGFDIVSGGELRLLQRIGVPGDRIVFSGVGKSREEIREALNYSISGQEDRKSTRLNSSHGYISYAVFCLKQQHTS